MHKKSYLLDIERRKIISEITENFWDEYKPILDNFQEKLKEKMTEKRAKELLDASCYIMERIVERFSEPRYIEKEEEHVHREIVRNLWDGFVNLFDSFIIENDIKTDEENIDLICSFLFRYMNYLKYERTATSGMQIPDAANVLFCYRIKDPHFETWKEIEKQLKNQKEFIRESYSVVTQMLRFLYNLEKHTRERPHRPKPKDWLTGKKSFVFGNMHTLHGLLVLACYAYLEILNIWLDSYGAVTN